MAREVCGICWCPYDEFTGECACAPAQPRGAMSREDIIRMALEANILEPVDLLESNQWRQDTIRELERFAALIAAAEREACAVYLERGIDLGGLAGHPGWQNYTADLLAGCAAAIRARGQQ